jgi:hypothetical protein
MTNSAHNDGWVTSSTPVTSRTLRIGASLLLSVSAAAGLSGCGGAIGFPDTETPGAVLALSGVVHGGQQPVTGSHVHVMQASAAHYGAPAAALMTANGTTILSDSIGPYVTTDSNGNFTISGDYVCSSGSQVYLLATQGNPGLGAGGNNPNLALMAGLGACPTATNFLATVPTIFIDEVSTVATAYSLSGYFTDATHLATPGSALSATGIKNAGANIALLSSIVTGQALATTPNGNGTVPQAEINTLANILAYCVNSTGSTCSSLFPIATSSAGTGGAASAALSGNAVTAVTVTAGGSGYTNPPTVVFTGGSGSGAAGYATVSAGVITGITVTSGGSGYTSTPTVSFSTTPTDTASAAINIAHNSGVNVASLAGLSSSSAPFQPTLSSAPNDFSISIHYVPTTAVFAVSGADGNTSGNGEIAIDASGNVWGPGNGFTSVVEFSPLGSVTKTISLQASAAVTGSYAKSLNIAVSPAGTIWAADYQLAYALPTASSFTVVSDSSANYAGVELAVAFDTSNDAWTGNNYPASFGEFSASGTLLVSSGYEPGGFAPQSSPATYPSDVLAVAVDSANHIWGICNQCSGSSTTPDAAEITNTGTQISGSTGDTAATIGYPSWIAIDRNNNAWISSFNGLLTEYNSSSVLQSGGGGYPTSGAVTGGLNSVAIDGSNTVWASGINNYFGALFSVNSSGALTSPSSGYQSPGPSSSSYYTAASIAVDGSGNIWTLDYNGGLHEAIGLGAPVVTPITPGSLGTLP